MIRPGIQLVAITPGAANLRSILETQLRQGPVVVTAFSNARLRSARSLVPEDADVEFFEFGALVGQYLSALGGMPAGLPGSGHSLAAVAEACRGLDSSSAFYESGSTPGFHRLLERCLDELRGYGVEADELDMLAESADDSVVSQLRAMAFVQRESAQLLSVLGKKHNRARIQDCLELAPETDYKNRIVVLAGTDDAPDDVRWLQWAPKVGAQVTVVVERHFGNSAMFRGGFSIEERLGLAALPRMAASDLAMRMFAENPSDGRPTDLEVEVSASADTFAECEWALRMASTEIASGVKPEKIAILARRTEDYAPLLVAASNRFGLTLSIARKRSLLTNGLARFLLSMLEAMTNRDVRVLNTLFRSSYCGIDHRHLKEMEVLLKAAHANRVDPWGTLYSLLTPTETSADDNPALQGLKALLEWRKEALESPAPLAMWATRFRDLGDLPWLDTALSHDSPTVTRDEYAQNAMQRALAETAAIIRLKGANDLNFKQFVDLSRRLWENSDVTIPQTPDGICICASAEELGDIEVLYVLGMLEGVFPRRRTEDPILSDDQRHWISEQLGINLPDSRRRADEERDEFYRVVCAPSRKLHFSYPQTGDDRDNVKAFYLTEVQRLMDIPHPTIHPRSQVAPESGLDADIRLARALDETPKEAALPNALATEEATAIVREKPGAAYHPDDLQRVLTCPFQYLTQGLLELRSHRKGSRWSRILNLPKIVKLASIPERDVAAQLLLEKLDEVVGELYGETTDDDITLIRAGGRRLIREWVEREFEARDVWPRDEILSGPRFGDDALRNKITLEDGSKVEFKATYPAVSKRDGYHFLHMFTNHDPIDSFSSEKSTWEKLRESDQLTLGIALLSLNSDSKPKQVGLEIDSTTGKRRLIMSPRSSPVPRVAHNFEVTAIDSTERTDIIKLVQQKTAVALARRRLPDVNAIPGDHCRYCDMGELCRRSKEFSDELDPFEALDEGEDV